MAASGTSKAEEFELHTASPAGTGVNALAWSVVFTEHGIKVIWNSGTLVSEFRARSFEPIPNPKRVAAGRRSSPSKPGYRQQR